LQPRPKSNDNSGFYFGGQLANLGADARPEELLVNHVPTFADGPQVSSDVRLEAYRLGYRMPIASGREAGAILPVSVQSLFGVAVVDASYQREGAERLMVEQGLLRGAPLVGLEFEWPISWRTSIASEVTATVPLETMPWIFSAQILGRYQLAGKREGGVRAFAGLGYERISVQDEAVNSFRSDSGPMLIFGIEARF
jgi:hypothetical protein